MELSKKTIFVLLGIGVIVAVLIAWKKNKDKKEKAKAELKEQINAGAGTFSGGFTAGVKPDDTYDPTMDVQRLLNAQSWYNDDEEAIYLVISGLGTKARLAKLRNAFRAKKGKDLEAWLAQDVFNDEEMQKFNSIITSLS